jgi:hypothetical protein
MQPKRKRKVSKHPTPTISCDELFVPTPNNMSSSVLVIWAAGSNTNNCLIWLLDLLMIVV